MVNLLSRLRTSFPALGVLLVGSALLGGCSSGEDEFTQSRIVDQCNESWPVCDLVAGCIIGNESYLTGQFPGTRRIIVRLDEASQVTASFFLKDIAAQGTATNLTFYEGGCNSQIRVDLTGDAFVTESQNVGYVARSENLNDVGDHRIEFTSDTQAGYDFKLDVVALRLLGTGGAASAYAPALIH